MSLIAALIWIFIGLVVLVVVISLPPVLLRARVDSLRLGENSPYGWSDAELSVHGLALFGGVKVSLTRRDGKSDQVISLLGVRMPLRKPTKKKKEETGSKRDSKRSKEALQSTHEPGRSKEATKSIHEPDRSKEALKSIHESGRSKKALKSRQQASPSNAKTKSRSRKPPVTWSEFRKLLPEITWLFKRSRRLLQLDAKGSLVQGFSDPFNTAIVQAIVSSLSLFPSVNIRPDYQEGKLEGWVEVSLRTYPLYMLYLFARFALRPGARAVWWPRLRKMVIRPPRKTKEVLST